MKTQLLDLVKSTTFKVVAAITIALLLGAGGAIIKHEVQLAGIDKDIYYIRLSQERIEKKLDDVLKQER